MRERLSPHGPIIVDEEDQYLLSRGTFYRNNRGYAYWSASRTVQGVETRYRLFLHRLIARPGPGMVVDHINGDILDNRRCNLRVCAVADNNRNIRRYALSRTGYRGVYVCGNRYHAAIRNGRKSVHLGAFGTPEEAARAYDAAAIVMHGQFAVINFPESQERAA